jgi:hypothetical protein
MLLNKSSMNASLSGAARPTGLKCALPHAVKPVGSVMRQQSNAAGSTTVPRHSIACPRRRVFCAAGEDKKQSDPVLKYANSIGLPTEEGVFGFRPFAEVSCPPQM